MAALAPTPAQSELISSLTQDEIPIKLRCAICSKLAVNAFRLPCCDQAICETCQSTLPPSCPVCEHSPLAAADCKPNKSLRTTIRVFLRTEEKKREAQRSKEAKDTPPATPIEPVAAPILPAVEPAAAHAPEYETTTVETILTANGQDEEYSDVQASGNEQLSVEDQQDIPQPSVEEITPGQEETPGGGDVTQNINAAVINGQLEQNQADGSGTDGLNFGQSDMSQTPGFGMGFDAMPGGFPNMAMMGAGGDMNQMQMMMAMQNGMAPNGFGGFPMMNMPGMTMDPMTMQNMFMNGGFGAQGMGMNMGMGMTGFDGGAGSGYNNGWGGQQSWNIGQDNFNLPNAASMGHGDFGANNSGFNRQNAAGYNQGNFGRQNNYNDFQQNAYGQQGQGYQSRGRGRGRGYGFGQGRGGQGYGRNDFSQHAFQNPDGTPSGPITEAGHIPTGPKGDATSSVPPSNVDAYGREIRANTETQQEGRTITPAVEKESTTAEDLTTVDLIPLDSENLKTSGGQDSGSRPIQTLEEAESVPAPSGANGFSHSGVQPKWGGRIPGSGGYVGYSETTTYGSMQPPQSIQNVIAVPDVPINAPTGPKAMRAGPSHTSMSMRGRGYSNAGRSDPRQNVIHAEPSVATVKSKSPTPEKEGDVPDRDRSRSRTRSERTDSRDRRKDKHRRSHRHLSTSISEDGKEEERRRDRRHRRSHRHEDGENENSTEAIESDTKTLDGSGDRTRSQSPSESRRSNHRSRRDREHDRERSDRDRERGDRGSDKDRERERDRDHKSSSHKHRSSHRSHRDRSPHHSSSRRDRDRERDRSRDHDRDSSRSRRHRRHHDSPEADAEITLSPAIENAAPQKDEVKIPSGPRAMSSVTTANVGMGIKGNARRQSIQEEMEKASRSNDRDRNGRDRDRERERRHGRSDREREHESKGSVSSERKGSMSASTSASAGIPAPTAAKEVDPHTLEREARNRERLLKEAQRIAGLASQVGGAGTRKRDRDDGPGGGVGRKKRRSEIGGDALEERIKRGETEREASRWG